MDCPFCKKKLEEGNLVCPHCRSLVIDFDYFENLERMEEKYGKESLLELSREKLTFSEIVTIRTFIERSDHHAGDSDFSDMCMQDGTFSNLSKRLKEIKKNDEYR